MNRYLVALYGLVLFSGSLLLWHLLCLGRKAWERHRADAQVLLKFEEMCALDVSEACQRRGINFTPGILRRFAWQNPYRVGRMFGALYLMLDKPPLSGWSWGLVQNRVAMENFFVAEILSLPPLTRQWFNAQRFSEGLSYCGISFKLPIRLTFALEVKKAEERRKKAEARKRLARK